MVSCVARSAVRLRLTSVHSTEPFMTVGELIVGTETGDVAILDDVLESDAPLVKYSGTRPSTWDSGGGESLTLPTEDAHPESR